MTIHLRKAYEVSEREVAQYFSRIPHPELLNAPLDRFLPELQYLVKIYRNAWASPCSFQLSAKDTFDVVLRFHRSIRCELRSAGDVERALKQRVFTRVHQLCLQHKIIHPEVNFKLKGTKAGTAGEQELRFNFVLFRENESDFLGQTVPHELCHIWKDQLGLAGKSHGNAWKNLMRRMGARPDVTHNMDVTRARVRTSRIHAYACRCAKNHYVTPEKHEKIQSVKSSRPPRCPRCKQTVRYVGIDKSLQQAIKV